MADELEGCTQATGALNARYEKALTKILVGAAEAVEFGGQLDGYGRDCGGKDAPDAGVAEADQFQLSTGFLREPGGSGEDILDAFGIDRSVVGEKVAVGQRFLRSCPALRMRIQDQDGPTGALQFRDGLRAHRDGRSGGMDYKDGLTFTGNPIAGNRLALAGLAKDSLMSPGGGCHVGRPFRANGRSQGITLRVRVVALRGQRADDLPGLKHVGVPFEVAGTRFREGE